MTATKTKVVLTFDIGISNISCSEVFFFLDKVILYVFELLIQSCNWKYIFDHRLLWTTQRNNSFLLALPDSLHSQDSQHRSKRGRRWPWPTASNRFNAWASIFNFNSPKTVQEKWETEVSGLNRWRNKWSKAPAATAVSGRATLKAAYRYSHGFNAAPEQLSPKHSEQRLLTSVTDVTSPRLELSPVPCDITDHVTRGGPESSGFQPPPPFWKVDSLISIPSRWQEELISVITDFTTAHDFSVAAPWKR